MKAFLIGASALLVASTASAAGNFYSCSGVGGVDEYTLEVDLDTNKAAFFDNNAWSPLPYTQTMILKSHPPQFVHIYAGNDADGVPMEIHFNETRLSAYVIENPETTERNALKVEGCRQVATLISGIDR